MKKFAFLIYPWNTSDVASWKLNIESKKEAKLI